MIMEDVVAGKRPERPSSHECNDALWALISRCWDINPIKRPDIMQVCIYVHESEIDSSFGMHFTISIIPGFSMTINL